MTTEHRTKHRSKRRHRGSKKATKQRHRLAWLLGLTTLVVAAWWGIHGPDGESPPSPPRDWDSVSIPQHVEVDLPADDAPHDLLTEWWYYNGHLVAQDGGHYSFHYVVFVRNTVSAISIAQVSFTDQRSGQHYTDQLRTAGNPSAGTKERFDFRFGAWIMSGSNGNDQLKAGNKDFAFDLRLTAGAAPVLHGGGLLDFKDAGKSYYYSRTRMPATGTVNLAGETKRVNGQVWFDHQWGDFKTTLLSWDWFALQLDDGRDIMLYRLRDAQGNPFLDAGSLAKGNRSFHLAQGEFQTEATGSWTSAATGLTYPMGWRVRLPERGIDLELSPVINHSEFDGRLTTFNTYWEGAIRITGSHSGIGFVELGGYDSAQARAGAQGETSAPDATRKTAQP